MSGRTGRQLQQTTDDYNKLRPTTSPHPTTNLHPKTNPHPTEKYLTYKSLKFYVKFVKNSYIKIATKED